MKISIRLILFLVILSLASFKGEVCAQISSYHLTIPDNTEDTVNLGSISYYSYLSNDSIWIHNPTNDTLKYIQEGYWQAGTYLYFNGGGAYIDSNSYLVSDSNSWTLTIPPHDSGRVSSVSCGFYGRTYRDDNDTVQQVIPILVRSVSVPTKEWIENIRIIASYHTLLPAYTFRHGDTNWYDYTLYRNQLVDLYLNLFSSFDSDHHSRDTVLTDSLKFFNDQDSDVIIQTLFVPEGSRYWITGFSGESFPYTLHHGELFTVYLNFSDTAGRNPTTIIDTNQGGWNKYTYYNDWAVVITDSTFPVSKATYNGAAPKANPKSSLSVKPSFRSEGQIQISANPVLERTEIDLKNARFAKFSIFNLLDSKVAEHSGSSWQWDGLSSAGSKLPHGLYTVKAEGVSIDGKFIHASRNIILMK